MKKVFKIVFISIVSICLLLLISGYFVLTQIDFNSYKKTIETVVFDTTGRSLKIGNISVKPSFNPVIEIKGLAFSNAKWAKEPEMFYAETIDLGFGLLALLNGKYEIKKFEVSNAKILLEENADGLGNWVVGSAKTEEETIKNSRWNGFSIINSAYADDTSNSDTAKLLSSLVIKKIVLDNVSVSYTDRKSQKQTYDIKKVSLNEKSDGNIGFDFDVNNGVYKGQGVLGALELINSRNGYPFEGKLEVNNIGIATNMKLFNLLGDLSFNGDVIVTDFMGKESGFNESVNVALKGDLKKIEAIVKSAKVAGNEVTGTVNVDLMSKIPVVGARLNSLNIDIASFAKKQKIAQSFKLVKSAYATTLVPEVVIPYDVLGTVKADVVFDVAQISKGAAVLAKDVTMNVNVGNGEAVFDISKCVVADGEVTANAVWEDANKTLRLGVNASKVNLYNLMSILNANSQVFKFMSGGSTDVLVNLVGQGDLLSNVIDSFDGQFVVVVDKSQLHVGNIGIMKGNIFSQLVNTLNLTKGNDNLNLSCAVVRSDVKDGKAVFPNGIVVNADKFTIVANGDINLKNDAVSISVKPFAGKLTDTNIAKALSSLVKLTGTLQNPKIGVDSANAIKTIVGVTTGGPVYLGAQMLLENDGSPCYTALQGTKYADRFPKPDNVISQTSGDVEKILGDSVDVVKDTTKGILNILTGVSNKSGKAN